MLLFLLPLNCFSQNKLKLTDSTTILKIDSLLRLTSAFADFNKKVSKIDTSVITADKMKRILEEEKPMLFDKLQPSIIALLAVIISSIVAYSVGRLNARTQRENAERQIQTQTTIALEQLKVAREQIEQTAKNTLTQVRANNLSQAHINWIQNLRPLLSTFIANISNISSIMDDVIDAENKNDSAMFTSSLDKVDKLAITARVESNQISLFLNLQSVNHQKLYDSITQQLLNITEKIGTKDKGINISAFDLIQKGRVVLEDAWEQAKKETVFE